MSRRCTRKTRTSRTQRSSALGEFDDPRAVDVLLEVLQEEEWVAFSAIYSLARIGNRRAVPALMDVFKNRSEELSLAACEALMSFEDDEDSR